MIGKKTFSSCTSSTETLTSNNLDEMAKNKNKASASKLSEDLRRCIKEKAFYHSQFYHRLSNDPETRIKLNQLESSNRISQNKLAHFSNNNADNSSTILKYTEDSKSFMESLNNRNKNIKLQLIQHTPLKTFMPTTISELPKPSRAQLLINNTSAFNKNEKNSLIPSEWKENQNKNIDQYNEYHQYTHVFSDSLNNIIIIDKNYDYDVNVSTSFTCSNDDNIENDIANSTDVTDKRLECSKFNEMSVDEKLNDAILLKDISLIDKNEKIITNNNFNENNSKYNNNIDNKNENENIFKNFDGKHTTNNNNNNTNKANESVGISYNKSLVKYNKNCYNSSCVSRNDNDDGSYGIRNDWNISNYTAILPSSTTLSRLSNNNKNSNNNINLTNNLFEKNSINDTNIKNFEEYNSNSIPSSSPVEEKIFSSEIPLYDSLECSLLSSDYLSSSLLLTQNDYLSYITENKQNNNNNNNNINCYNVNKGSHKNVSSINSKFNIKNVSEQLNNSNDSHHQEQLDFKLNLIKLNNSETTDIDDGQLIRKRKRDLYRKFLKDQQKLETEEKFRRSLEIKKTNEQEYRFPCVEKLVEMYSNLLQEKNASELSEKNSTSFDSTLEQNSTNRSPVSDEGCQIGLSPYSSDGEEHDIKEKKEKVARSSSSDSALGLEEDLSSINIREQINEGSACHNRGRRATLTVTDIPLRPALLPVAEPIRLPTNPDISTTITDLSTKTAIPSKVLLEERVVEIPEDRFGSLSNSRRESAQSCFSEASEFGVRYVRTPSVVVSDYSDDVMCGITLEEIEYFRAQRRRRSSAETEKDDACSDFSGSSSCSNLYYCGSTISALDGSECYVNGIRTKIDRKSSTGYSSSVCSSAGVSDDEIEDRLNFNEEFQDHLTADKNNPQYSVDTQQGTLKKFRKKPSGWRKIRNIVQWTPFFQTYKKQRYPWVQLAGHQGNFKAGPEQGTVLKKLCPKEEMCFQFLMKDTLKAFVPEYKGQVTSEDGELYLQLQDLLSDFYQPCVMDCKIGVRTYLEEELSKAKEKPKLRKDMYEKMIQIDPEAPNEDEHKAKGVTKPRYMVWRETISSTATLGFRIEGIKKSDGASSKDFKTTKSRDQIKKSFQEFTDSFPQSLPRYLQRLRSIRDTLQNSDFFKTHEVIGSSLLFVHDRLQANIWLIDFAKTVQLPDNHEIDHNTLWKVGNHEDGYLIGINNLIEIFMEIEEESKNVKTNEKYALLKETADLNKNLDSTTVAATTITPTTSCNLSNISSNKIYDEKNNNNLKELCSSKKNENINCEINESSLNKLTMTEKNKDNDNIDDDK